MEIGRPVRLGALTFFAALSLSLPFAKAEAQRPTPEQAQALLQSRPDLVAQLRQRIMTSGLTPAQIRARLRAEGYPENLLDAYLQGGDSTVSEPTEDVYSAVVTLGIADSADVREIRNSNGRRARRGLSDTTDTTAARLARRPVRRVVTGDSLSSFDPRLDERIRNTSGRPGRRATADTAALREADTLSIFGIDIFASGTSQFDPNLNGPVDANYRLGPGDRLVLVLTGDVEASYSLDITREGFVVIPQVGRVDVANLTMGQLEDVLYTRLGRVYSGVRRGGGSTRFSISPARLRSNQVYVIGDVAEPGSYRISAAGTVLTALYAAGGPTNVGSMRNVEIRRAGKIVDHLDVYDYLLRGDASHDPRLENGDVVFVPVHGPQVTVSGEVVRPAVYEVKAGENLIDAIRAAGGFRATANKRRAQIERIVPLANNARPGRDRIVIDVDSDRLAEGEGTGIPLEDGDVIHVFAVTDRVRDRVRVVGNVWNPGQVGFTPGMKISDALRMSGGVKPDVYVGEVLISRLQGDSTRVQLRTMLRDSLGAVSNDMVLADDDEIRVFSVTEFRPTRFVAINGAVRKPGRYPFRDGMTMRDLVLLAGGVEERAYLREAEVARLPEQREGGRLATTMRVPLDSTYLFERTASAKYLGPPGIPVQQGGAPAPEVQLSAYDNVLILEQPDWELQRNVIVTGEVRFPGVYSLKSKGERLSDVLQRAGGLTSEGYADGVFFLRKRGALGRIGIDLPKVLKEAGFRDNLILQDGDSIDVPAFNNVVTVGGAVNSPVAVAYVPGQDLDFYIRAAGGLNTKADSKRAYVTQPNGKVESRKARPFFPDGVPKPRAGSVVFVPNKEAGEKRDLAPLFIGIAQIVGSLVTLGVVIINTTKK
jgi:polysaccharide export outer membrane protein